jgi:magnesium transporter
MNPTAHLIEPEVRELIHDARYSELREVLTSIPPADVGEILSNLEADQAAVAFRFLLRDDAAEVFTYLAVEKQEEIIARLGDKGSVRIFEAMDPDDRVRLIDELPAEVAQRLIASLNPEDRKETQAILGYKPGSVGRLMTPDYVRVRSDWTIAHALDHLRRHGRDAETINVVYVTNEQGVLIDDIRLRQLLLASPEDIVESLMNRSFVTLRAEQDQEEAVRLLQRYDRVALPVVDSRGVLLGIVTHDDLADVAEQEATEDIQKIGGVEALDDPYMATPLLHLVRKRGTWLGLLFMSELLTSNALQYYDGEIQKATVLAIFLPAVMSSGGNSGSQASTLVIRALALQEIKLGDWWRVLRRELACGTLLGLLIGAISIVRVNLWGVMGWWSDPAAREHYKILSVAMFATLTGVVLWGSIMGSMLPFVLKRLRLDPAASSTPFVATLVDVTGIIIYFTCAKLILSGTLL